MPDRRRETVKRLFDDSLYRFDEPQPSYWEATPGDVRPAALPLAGERRSEVAIIGGGYTGLSAALHLARDHGIEARVLEAGHIGWGASGRNGGFCTMGSSKLSPAAQVRRFGVDETRAFYRAQAEAVELVRELARDEDIDLREQGDCEYTVAESPAVFDALAAAARRERDLLGVDARVVPAGEFAEIGYRAPRQHGAIAQRPSFGLHPLRYLLGLAAAAERRGAGLHAHSEVLRWRRTDGLHRLETAHGRLDAERVILTGNGFMPEHLHPWIAGRPLPLQSAIVTTRAMSAAERRERGWFTESPAINAANTFFYYRLLDDGRFLLGGRADHRGDPASAALSYAELKREVIRRWPAFEGLEFTHQWRGLICMTRNFRPTVGRMPVDPSVYFAFGYHGNGVNSATWSGREVARWLARGPAPSALIPQHLPAIVRGPPPRFPLPGLRPLYLKIGLGWYRLLDRLGG